MAFKVKLSPESLQCVEWRMYQCRLTCVYTVGASTRHAKHVASMECSKSGCVLVCVCLCVCVCVCEVPLSTTAGLNHRRALPHTHTHTHAHAQTGGRWAHVNTTMFTTWDQVVHLQCVYVRPK